MPSFKRRELTPESDSSKSSSSKPSKAGSRSRSSKSSAGASAHSGAMEQWLAPSTASAIDQIDVALIDEGWAPERVGEAPLDATVAAIEAVGVVEPVLLRPRVTGRFEVVTGHRTVAAARFAGMSRVPAVVKELDDMGALMALVFDGSATGQVTPRGADALRTRLSDAGAAAEDIEDVMAAVVVAEDFVPSGEAVVAGNGSGPNGAEAGAEVAPAAEVTPAAGATPAAEAVAGAEVTPAAEAVPGAEATPAAEDVPGAEAVEAALAAEATPEAEAAPTAEAVPAADAAPDAPGEPIGGPEPATAGVETAPADVIPAELLAEFAAAVAEGGAAAAPEEALTVDPAADAAAEPAWQPEEAPAGEPLAADALDPEPVEPAAWAPTAQPELFEELAAPAAGEFEPHPAAAPEPIAALVSRRESAAASSGRWLPLPAGRPRLARLSSAFADAPRMLRILGGDRFTGTAELVGRDGRNDVVAFLDGRILATYVEQGERRVDAPLRLPSPERGPTVEITVRPHPRAVSVALALALRSPARFTGLHAEFLHLPGLLDLLRRERADAACVVTSSTGAGVILLDAGQPVAAYARRWGDEPGEEAETTDVAAVLQMLVSGDGEADVHTGAVPEPLDLEEAIARAVPGD